MYKEQYVTALKLAEMDAHQERVKREHAEACMVELMNENRKLKAAVKWGLIAGLAAAGGVLLTGLIIGGAR